MIKDALLQFDPPATSVAIAAGTQASTNIIDVGIDGIPTEAQGGGARDMGIGDKPAMKVNVQVDVAFASAGSTGTIQVAVQGAEDDGTGAPGSWVTLVTGPAHVVPVVGAQLLKVDLPRAEGIVPRFYRLLYTVAVQTMTAGSVNAQLVIDEPSHPSDAPGFLGAYRAGLNVAN